MKCMITRGGVTLEFSIDRVALNPLLEVLEGITPGDDTDPSFFPVFYMFGRPVYAVGKDGRRLSNWRDMR